MHSHYHPTAWALLGLGESVSCHLCAEGRSYYGGLASHNFLVLAQEITGQNNRKTFHVIHETS